MRYLYIILAFAIAISCVKEMPDSPASHLKDNESEWTGAVIVEFSDEMCDLIEDELSAGKLITKSQTLNSAVDELGIVFMERLFPDAGEFEQKHRQFGLHKIYKVVFEDKSVRTRAESELKSLPGIVQANAERRIQADAGFFNDPQYLSQWGYRDGKNPTASINVEPVWKEFTTGDSKVIVAVVDYGIDNMHSDLAASCIAGGDKGSKNFCDGSYNIVAERHGTHVGGIIGAANNNGSCVSGIAGGDARKGVKGVRLLSCQVFQTGKSNGNTGNAIIWAADHGAVIVNNSWTDVYDTQAEAEAATINFWDRYAINYFVRTAGKDNAGNQTGPMAGGVVFFSAGNKNWPNSTPSNYESVIAVGASDRNRGKCSFSNYGDWVDIAAPGTGIISTVPGNAYASMNGTSMACPHVSGIAALLVSYYGGPGFTNDRLKEKLLGGANKKAISPDLKIGPLADAMNAFWYGAYPPDKVADLTLESAGNTAAYSFSITGDKEKTKAYSYVVAASEDKAALQAYDLSSKAVPAGIIRDTISTADHRLGEKLSGRIEGLGYEKKYYVAVAGYTKDKKLGEMSDIAEVLTGKNNPPVITPEKTGPFSLSSADAVYVRYSVSDPEKHKFEVIFLPGSPAATYEYSGGVVKVAIAGNMAPSGNYTARIIARDEFGAEGIFDIEYSIMQNHAPVLVRKIEDFIVYGAGQEYSFNMNDYFSDADGDHLSYKADSEKYSSVIANISGNTLTVSTSVFGLGEVSITAADNYGESCQTSFKVFVVDPEDPVSLYPNPVGETLTIRAGEPREAHIRIISHAGTVVLDKTLTISGFNPAAISVSSIAPGVYKAEVNYEGQKYLKTIVKK